MTADPSPVIRVAVAHFPPTRAAVPEVRVSTVRILTEWSVESAAVDVAEMVVCELASKAVKASCPEDVVAIRLTATSEKVLIEIWDGNDAGPRINRPDELSEDGRGLFMVDALCGQWSWHRAKTGGKVVWAEIAGGLRPAARAADAAMPTRTRTRTVGPAPTAPVVYRTDLGTLRRVADALRGLDTWHRPQSARRATEVTT